ncbi:MULTISPECIES: ABC transporter ATP-binding protein [unclassified Acidovorax]|uniref:ABC transporter ATP-binding protein n=1 Tax=unclassified Acidovorax TaxID=2684926 RepID=UPI00070118A3|nr:MULTISPECIES: ABC transporter ATP-binding protein [unclassified Acidovorax]KQW23680.1 ABC transporter ATP-binding protein [Acidovorax sp. Root402]MBD9405596.1 ABC transporter ATP-binding protein [Acidovorax sp. ACV02]MBL7087867.1 ABC transporter ATP-binding protein [Acidovorax sp.]
MANGVEPSSAPALLSVDNLSAGYGKIRALHGVSLRVPQARIVCVLGANGAGKTTLMRALSGLLPVSDGQAIFDGQSIANVPAEALVRRGIAHVPQGRMVFAQLTVRDNLVLGGYTRPAAEVRDDIDRVLGYFPRLKERITSRAGTLSGGEQQMLAIARGLLAKPRLLMLDEPSMGVAPILKDAIFETLRDIRDRENLTLLIVEQDADIALDISDEGYVIETGRVVMQGPASELAGNEDIRRAYLGG